MEMLIIYMQDHTKLSRPRRTSELLVRSAELVGNRAVCCSDGEARCNSDDVVGERKVSDGLDEGPLPWYWM